jgi:hypothetical protein
MSLAIGESSRLDGLAQTVEAGAAGFIQGWMRGFFSIVGPNIGLKGSATEKIRFAPDSPLKGEGFEPSVPRKVSLCRATNML